MGIFRWSFRSLEVRIKVLPFYSVEWIMGYVLLLLFFHLDLLFAFCIHTFLCLFPDIERKTVREFPFQVNDDTSLFFLLFYFCLFVHFIFSSFPSLSAFPLSSFLLPAYLYH